MFDFWIENMKNEALKKKMEEIMEMIEAKFPDLKSEIKWNQPMLTDHGTYIIGFSAAKNHISVAPEIKGMEVFHDAIEKAGYSQTPNLFRITASQTVDLDLIEKIIAFNIEDKKECRTFWR